MVKYNKQGVLIENTTHTDIDRLRESGLSGQFWAIYPACETQGKDAVRVVLEQIDTMKRLFDMFPDVFRFARNSQGKTYLNVLIFNKILIYLRDSRSI